MASSWVNLLVNRSAAAAAVTGLGALAKVVTRVVSVVARPATAAAVTGLGLGALARVVTRVVSVVARPATAAAVTG